MHTASLPYRLAPDVLFVPAADGGARLLDMDGQFFALSESAARMLRDALELGPDEAADNVARQYGADREQVRQDLETFLADLTRQGLIASSALPTRRRRSGSLPARMILSALIRLAVWLRPTLLGQAAGLLALSKWSCRWLGWAATVRLWQRLFPRAERLVEGQAAVEAGQAIDEAVQKALARSALASACKERGLAGWALARRAGLDPRLVVGLSLYPTSAHCWAQLGTTFLGDDPLRCAEYEPVLTYE
jgi:hypothetical protein